jgi:hypothetical protein
LLAAISFGSISSFKIKLMPFKSFINVIIYLSVAFTIFRLKEKFLISNIFMKFLIITGISFFIILIKELYGFMTSKFLF